MRRASAALLLVGLGALGSCSSSYAPWGDGGCDTFCNRWIGAHCRAPAQKEECITTCVTNRDLCPAHQRALLRCANLEGNIVCDGDNGATKIANCGLAQDQLDACLSCATFCRNYVGLGCPKSRDLGECIASCVDPRCLAAHLNAVTACGKKAENVTCGDDGYPAGGGSPYCGSQLGSATSCVQIHGGGRAFSWMPDLLPPDTGAADIGVDASEGLDSGFPMDSGTFPN